MRIFTSYYGQVKALKKEGIACVSISLYNPKWIDKNALAGDIKTLAPTHDMMNMDIEHYKRKFDRLMTDVNWKNILSLLKTVAKDGDVALLCYEKPEDFCHRHIVARWITEQTGYTVTEWEPPAKVEKQPVNQISLF